MRPTFSENTRQLYRNCWDLPFPAGLLIAAWLTGCNNTCFTITSNPPTGTLGIRASDPSPTCRLTKATAAVRVQLGTEPACSSCAGSGQVQHIFLSIRGIEVHPSTIADDDSTDWLELFPPELVKQPLQIDLMRGGADRGAREQLGGIVAIPAGIYRLVRLSFVPNQPATDDRLPESNACGRVGFNCVVMEDGRVLPLLLDGTPPQLQVTSDRIEGGSILIPFDSSIDLIVELKLVWLWISSADEGVRLLPALTGKAKVRRVPFEELGDPEDGVAHDSLSRLAHD
jgi:hypothetical protein